MPNRAHAKGVLEPLLRAHGFDLIQATLVEHLPSDRGFRLTQWRHANALHILSVETAEASMGKARRQARRQRTEPGTVRYTAFLRPDQINALRKNHERTGVPAAEQIRRALDAALGTRPPRNNKEQGR